MTNQKEFLTNLLQNNPDAVIVGSLGTISYDLNEIGHQNKILVKGAMGCVVGLGVGYAMGSSKQVIVVIGDGSFLMKMGILSSILKYDLKNLRIIIMDNHKYKSCGEQATNFSAIKHLIPLEIYEVE